MSNPEEQHAAIESVKRGERVKGKYSIHDKEIPGKCPGFNHRWRTLFCDSETDVVECQDCGKQGLAKCDFDEEYA